MSDFTKKGVNFKGSIESIYTPTPPINPEEEDNLIIIILILVGVFILGGNFIKLLL